LSYLVLARKSRPQTFAEVVGQKPVVRTLQNALRQNRVPHGLIFSGVRGTGKTTLARIMAKALNCEQGITDEPCCECRSCREIKNGSAIDLHEIDGASNRGIDDIRELRENIRFQPTNSRFKIIIIDEVHMLTDPAFNALLKTLEEPPDHVYFMFATTELHKVPITILSRCQRYELKRVSHADLGAHFSRLAAEEGVEIDQQALDMIVREAGGSVRDGLSLLDQVFSYCGDRVTADEAREVLGLVSREVIADIAEALLSGDLSRALAELDRIYTFGMDLKRFINELLSWFRGLVVCSVSRNPGSLLDLPADELERLQAMAAAHSSQTLLLVFHLLMDGLDRASFSARPRFAVEMVFIKVVQAGDVVPVTELLGRLDAVLDGVRLEEVTVPVVKKQPPSSVPPASPQTPAPSRSESTSEPAAAEKEAKKDTEEDEPQSEPAKGEIPLPPEPDMAPVPEPEPAPASVPEPEPVQEPPRVEKKPSLPERDVRKEWPAFIDYVRDREKWMAAALQVASSARIADDRLIIEYEDSVNCRIFKDRDKLIPLTEYAMDFFQQSLKVQFKVPDSTGCDTDPESGAALQKERQALANDSLVLTACEIFSGQVGDIRVGPRFRKPLHSSDS
jgi:DNA polymerase-3 subunit gamma/tau